MSDRSSLCILDSWCPEVGTTTLQRDKETTLCPAGVRVPGYKHEQYDIADAHMKFIVCMFLCKFVYVETLNGHSLY